MSASLEGGSPNTLATTGFGVFGIAVGNRDVYFTSGNLVLSVPLGGGAPRAVGASRETVFVTVDETNVYWTSDNGILRAPLDGGNVVTIDSDPFAWALTVDDTSVYWTSQHSIMKAPK
jgi:hypothetical protein